MLPNWIVSDRRTEKVWSAVTGKNKKAQITGYLLLGVYYQSYSFDHLIRNAGLGIVNGKGMDTGIYTGLQSPRLVEGRLYPTTRWEIHEEHTHKIHYIPFKSIAVLIEAHVAKQADLGWGLQVFVPLDRFTAGDKKPLDLPAIQKELFKI